MVATNFRLCQTTLDATRSYVQSASNENLKQINNFTSKILQLAEKDIKIFLTH
jgi:hypothetical protein